MFVCIQTILYNQRMKQVIAQARFWNRVKISAPNSTSCWVWQGPTTDFGYGIASDANRKYILAHRFVAAQIWDIQDKVVMHVCDNPACVNPRHLAVGSHMDNTHDMITKGRHPTAKHIYSADQVRHIRQKAMPQKDYAALYNTSVSMIGRIQRRESYAHIV